MDTMLPNGEEKQAVIKKHSVYKTVSKRTVNFSDSKAMHSNTNRNTLIRVKPSKNNEMSLFSNDEPTYKPTGSDRITLPVNSVKYGHSMRDLHARRHRNIRRNITLKPAINKRLSLTQQLLIQIKSFFYDLVRHLNQLDFWVIISVLLLSLCGIVAVHSATHSFNNIRFDVMQCAMTFMGFLSIFILSYSDSEKLAKKYQLIFILNIILLIITIIFGVGPQNSGASDTNRNWLRLGPIGIQPSEFSKIMYIFTFAIHISKVKDNINSLKNIAFLLLHSLTVTSLVLLQKDLGMAIVFAIITTGMLFCAKINWIYISTVLGGVILSLPFVWSSLSNYQQKRILVGFNPELDPKYFGYQVIRSKTAIGAGGIFGSGYMNGSVSQSDYFPAKQTDMIFSVICEEFGLIGASVVLLLYGFLILRLFSLSKKLKHSFEKYFCCGLCCMLIFQIIENIGMCLGFMPVIGITLPFISYGGSSVLSLYIAFGLVVSMSKTRERSHNHLNN